MQGIHSSANHTCTFHQASCRQHSMCSAVAGAKRPAAGGNTLMQGCNFTCCPNLAIRGGQLLVRSTAGAAPCKGLVLQTLSCSSLPCILSRASHMHRYRGPEAAPKRNPSAYSSSAGASPAVPAQHLVAGKLRELQEPVRGKHDGAVRQVGVGNDKVLLDALHSGGQVQRHTGEGLGGSHLLPKASSLLGLLIIHHILQQGGTYFVSDLPSLSVSCQQAACL